MHITGIPGCISSEYAALSYGGRFKQEAIVFGERVIAGKNGEQYAGMRVQVFKANQDAHDAGAVAAISLFFDVNNWADGVEKMKDEGMDMPFSTGGCKNAEWQKSSAVMNKTADMPADFIREVNEHVAKSLDMAYTGSYSIRPRII